MGTEETALDLIRLARVMRARSAMLREVDCDAGSARLFQAATIQRHRTLSALDRLRVGVILLDGPGKPAHLNRAATDLAKQLRSDAQSADSMS
jgi:hypothetical protein